MKKKLVISLFTLLMFTGVDLLKAESNYEAEVHRARESRARLEQKIQEDSLKEEISEAIKRHRVVIGMTKDEVIESKGMPEDVNRTVTEGSVSEQWCYTYMGLGRTSEEYVYFDKTGRVVSWQD